MKRRETPLEGEENCCVLSLQKHSQRLGGDQYEHCVFEPRLSEGKVQHQERESSLWLSDEHNPSTSYADTSNNDGNFKSATKSSNINKITFNEISKEEENDLAMSPIWSFKWLKDTKDEVKQKKNELMK